MSSSYEPTILLVPRHPDEGCHEAQLQLLTLEEDLLERARLAQLLRWGNATYCYYHHHEAEVTEADFLEWLEGLPTRTQATMRALGYEEMQDSLPLRRYVLEKNDIGMSEFLKILLSPSDWQAYQASNEAVASPLLAGIVPFN